MPVTPDPSGNADEFLGEEDGKRKSDGTFDMDKFYTMSTNGKGTRNKQVVWITPALSAGIGELVSRRIVGEYRSSADVIRDLLAVGIFYRTEQLNDPAFTQTRNVFMRQQELDRMRAEVESHDAVLEDCKYLLERSKRNPNDLRRALRYAHETIEDLGLESQRGELRRLIAEYEESK